MACELLVAAFMQDLVPWPRIKPGPPALGVRSLTHWTTKGSPQSGVLKNILSHATDLQTSLNRVESQSGKMYFISIKYKQLLLGMTK